MERNRHLGAGRAMRRTLALASAGVALTAAALVGAAPAMANTTVTAWAHGDVKAGPGNGERTVSFVNPGFTYDAICWQYGDPVTIPGSSEQNSKWVKLQLNSGGEGWVPGAYLRGNDTGGVPNRC